MTPQPPAGQLRLRIVIPLDGDGTARLRAARRRKARLRRSMATTRLLRR